MEKKKALLLCIIPALLMMSGCGGSDIKKNDRVASQTESVQAVPESPAADETAPADTGETETSPADTEAGTETETEATEETEVTTAETDSASDTTDAGDTEAVAARVNEIFFPVRNTGAGYCVKAISLTDDTVIDAGNCEEKMVSASLIKLFVAGTVYEQMETVQPQESYAGETEDLISIMISNSDNDACNTLVTRLGLGDPQEGMKAVDRFCVSHNFPDTEMNRLMLDFNGLENYTTPADVCNILRCYYNGELAGSGSVVSYLKAQTVRTKIPAGITDGTVVANKTGELANVENDSAIVYADNGAYILCIMSDELTDTASAREAIISSASAVHEYMKNR